VGKTSLTQSDCPDFWESDFCKSVDELSRELTVQSFNKVKALWLYGGDEACANKRI
jgi:hypothetical protein